VKTRVALAPLVRDAARTALAGTAVRVEMAFDATLPELEVDEAQLHQALGNLLLNARQAMGDTGEILISAVRLPAPPAAAAHLPPGPCLELVMEDRGPGIAPENLSKIFDPFFTTREFGRGLGLPTAFSIVKRHGGHLWAESRPGYGAVLHLLLPSTERPPALKLTPPRGFGRARFDLRVLVMDDEMGVLRAAARLLKSLGAEAETAANGDEAIRRAAEAVAGGKPFDIAILDLTIIGGRGGLATVGELKDASPRTSAIVSSGYADDVVMADPEAHGFDAVLPKPYTLDDLVRALKEAQAKNAFHLRSV
jgi:CheY-like chemotaxis protein